MTPKPANKPIIAVDMDDVLAEHVEDFIKFSNTNYGTSLGLQDYLEQWIDLWGVPMEEVERRAAQFLIPQNTDNFAVVKDAKQVLGKLKRSYKLVVVSARPKIAVESGKEWINRHFPDIFSEVHFVPVWDPGPKTTKAEICRQIGADYLIDDLIRHCNLAADVGIKAILFDRIGWKQPEKPRKDLIYVKSWQGVLEYFGK